MENFWDYSAWGAFSLVAVLLIALLLANVLKRVIKPLRASLIPTSVLGGGILLVLAGLYRLTTGDVFFDTAFFGGNGTANLELITYHTLALGFIASTFKSGKEKMSKKRSVEIFNTGVTTVATYLLQGVFGLAISVLAVLVVPKFFSAAGMLLPFGYGQGTGQAMNYGNIYETDWGFGGGKSFGLAIAALGFLSASIGGVIHLMVLKKQGKVYASAKDKVLRNSDIETENEIPMQESVDKLTVQVALVAVAYLVAYLIMFFLGKALPGMRSVIYGFNFLLGVLSTVLVKFVLKLFRKSGMNTRDYINDFLMTRVSNFFFDIMVVAGIAAIRLSILKDYWGIILITGVVGLVITYIYNRIVAKTLFAEYAEEQFLAMFGMLTGTASTGIILLREIDGDFKTPAADNLVYQNFPAIVFGFPLMFLATYAPKAPVLTMIILAIAFAAMNVILFRSKIFKRRNK
ncbi:MAG: hypothetical protein IJB24_03130 [Clostridia bacterium]|nr:hypothetical protein [Clostridia bacterium]